MLYRASLSYGGVYLLIRYTQIELKGSVLEFGYFLTVAGISTLLFVGISGNLAKKYGANIICAAGIFIFGIGFGILHFIDNINLFYYLAASLIGLGWSFYYAASPMIILSDVVKEEDKGRYISLISVAVVLGTSSLPVLYDLCNSKNVFLVDIYLYTFIISLVGSIIFIYLNKLFPSKKEK